MSGWNGAFDLQNFFFRSAQEEPTESEGLPASVQRGRTAEPSGAAAQVHSLKQLTGHVKSAGF